MPSQLQPLLSVLILTVPERYRSFFPRLIDHLLSQSEGSPVEILALFDNKLRSVGEKRNALLSLAQGKFVAFVDDDDRVADDYIASLIDAIQDNPAADVIVFDQIVRRNGKKEQLCRYGVEFQRNNADPPAVWKGPPAHTACWRAEVAKRFQFPDRNFGEDSDWVARASAAITVERQVRIDKVLYHYDFNVQTSETRQETANGCEARTIYSHLYASNEFEKVDYSRLRYKWALDLIDNETPASVIDVGSGRGELLALLDNDNSFRPSGKRIAIQSVDCWRFHALPEESCKHTNADLSTRKGRTRIRKLAKAEVATCLHVLEKLPEHAARRMVFNLAGIAKHAAVTIDLGSNEWHGQELNLTQRTPEWWRDLILEAFEIKREAICGEGAAGWIGFWLTPKARGGVASSSVGAAEASE